MTKIKYGFLKNLHQAKKVCEDYEKFLRKVETIGCFRASEENGAINSIKTAIAFSVLTPHCRQHLGGLAKEKAGSEGELQKILNDFITVNCCYENAAAYYLEGFRQKFVKKNTGWSVAQFACIDSIRVELNGLRHFKYFGHTKNPLYVK